MRDPQPIDTQFLQSILSFITIVEKLKTELRHSWTSNAKRQESVAEHTWMMSLLSLMLFERINHPFDKLKCLKMIIVHDLAEAIAHDIPAFDIKDRSERYISERAAMQKITGTLDDQRLADELMALWEAFEQNKTVEAHIAQAMDKLEVIIQHNVADISTWSDGDYAINPYYKDELFDFDPVLRVLKDIVNRDAMKKIERSGNLHRISEKHRTLWKGSKD